MSNVIEWIKRIYIYLFSAIGLIITIVGGIQLINLGLKSFVFTKADIYYNYPSAEVMSPKDGVNIEQPDPDKIEEYQRNDLISRRQRQASNALAMIIVGLPVFLYHWSLTKRQA